MRWFDRLLLTGAALGFLGGAALFAGAHQNAGAVDRTDARPIARAGDLDHRIATIIERCVIQGAGTHLASIRCEFRK